MENKFANIIKTYSEINNEFLSYIEDTKRKYGSVELSKKLGQCPSYIRNTEKRIQKGTLKLSTILKLIKQLEKFN